MDALIEFAQRGPVTEIVGAVSRSSMVLGVVIDVDPIWQLAWRLHERHDDRLAAHPPRWWFAEREPWGLGPLLSAPNAFLGPVDPKWRPDWWHDYLNFRYGKFQFDDPFIVKICLSTVAGRLEAIRPELPTAGVPVRFEWRTPASLAGNPKHSHRPVIGGVSAGCGTSLPFTIGGIVHDGLINYAVTCAHAVKGHSGVEQPSLHDGVAGPIGRVTKQFNPIPNPAGKLCNPWSGLSTMNEMDAALVELHSHAHLEVLDIGAISGVAPRSSVWPGQTVEMTGRTSGYKSLEIGGLAAVYRIDDGPDSYCFKNLFELRQPLAGFGLPRACRDGDSGAWVCSPIGLKQAEWVGMVTAADSLIGYGVFAETIESWWSTQGLSLRVL